MAQTDMLAPSAALPSRRLHRTKLVSAKGSKPEIASKDKQSPDDAPLDPYDLSHRLYLVLAAQSARQAEKEKRRREEAEKEQRAKEQLIDAGDLARALEVCVEAMAIDEAQATERIRLATRMSAERVTKSATRSHKRPALQMRKKSSSSVLHSRTSHNRLRVQPGRNDLREGPSPTEQPDASSDTSTMQKATNERHSLAKKMPKDNRQATVLVAGNGPSRTKAKYYIPQHASEQFARTATAMPYRQQQMTKAALGRRKEKQREEKPEPECSPKPKVAPAQIGQEKTLQRVKSRKEKPLEVTAAPATKIADEVIADADQRRPSVPAIPPIEPHSFKAELEALKRKPSIKTRPRNNSSVGDASSSLVGRPSLNLLDSSHLDGLAEELDSEFSIDEFTRPDWTQSDEKQLESPRTGVRGKMDALLRRGRTRADKQSTTSPSSKETPSPESETADGDETRSARSGFLSKFRR